MITLYALHFGGYWYSAIPALPIGYFISIHETRINQLLSLHRATIIVTTIIAIWIVAYFSISHRQALQPAINIIIPLAVYILIKCLPNQHHVKIIDQIGSMSYEIYLCQGLFCIFLQHSPLPISLLLMTLGTILLATILYRCLSPHPKQQSSNS